MKCINFYAIASKKNILPDQYLCLGLSDIHKIFESIARLDVSYGGKVVDFTLQPPETNQKNLPQIIFGVSLMKEDNWKEDDHKIALLELYRLPTKHFIIHYSVSGAAVELQNSQATFRFVGRPDKMSLENLTILITDIAQGVNSFIPSLSVGVINKCFDRFLTHCNKEKNIEDFAWALEKSHEYIIHAYFVEQYRSEMFLSFDEQLAAVKRLLENKDYPYHHKLRVNFYNANKAKIKHRADAEFFIPFRKLMGYENQLAQTTANGPDAEICFKIAQRYLLLHKKTKVEYFASATKQNYQQMLLPYTRYTFWLNLSSLQGHQKARESLMTLIHDKFCTEPLVKSLLKQRIITEEFIKLFNNAGLNELIAALKKSPVAFIIFLAQTARLGNADQATKLVLPNNVFDGFSLTEINEYIKRTSEAILQALSCPKTHEYLIEQEISLKELQNFSQESAEALFNRAKQVVEKIPNLGAC